MDQLFGLSQQGLLVIPAFLFVLTVVVFFHELGHFLVARWCGVTVKAFSIGFGKEIFGWTDRHGTRWKFAWIPLGGYVKFMDDENVASVPDRDAVARMSPEEQAGSFHGKPLWQRAAVVAAGPVANFILAIVIFAVMFTFVGQRNTAALIDEVTPGGAAERAGFQQGDIVISIDGRPIANFTDMQRIVSTSADQPLTFGVRRGEDELSIVATPERREITDRFGNTVRQGILGIRRTAEANDWTLEKHDPFTATGMAAQETWFVVSATMSYLYDVVAGRESADQLGGPIRIAQISGQAASAGFLVLLNLAAVLSISIGLINLFPIPMLDGGHLLFYAIEGARGRPLSERSQEIGFRVGLALVLMLMVFATWNDISQLLS
jgi:regulator of sigma E protease